MVKRLVGVTMLAISIAGSCTVGAAHARSEPKEDLIPYESFTLSNGLKVIVSEDRDVPQVNVSVWYKVGAKDEPKGKTGFAHLFEHILFRGSENFEGKFFDVMVEAGATMVNGTTDHDRTNYFESVPTPALERILWLESDRMGHLLGAVTQEALDAEIGIVKNEKKLGQDNDMAKAGMHTFPRLFPEGHPYHRSVIGSIEDLESASLNDIHTWHKTHYGAANAFVVLTGDIDVETAKDLIGKYFGHIEPGPSHTKLEEWIPTREHSIKEVMTGDVGLSKISRSWAIPSLKSDDYVALEALSQAISLTDDSRLQKMFNDKLGVSTVSFANVMSMELAGIFTIEVHLKPDVNIDKVDKALDEFLEDLLKDGLTKTEMNRIHDSYKAVIDRPLEMAGIKGFLLAQGELYADDPGRVSDTKYIGADISEKTIMQAARKWLSKGFYQLTTVKPKEYKAEQIIAKRDTMPPIDNQLAFSMPGIETAKLSNGMKVYFAQNTDEPLVEVAMSIKGGGRYAERGNHKKLATAVIDLMNMGPASMSAAEFIDKLVKLSGAVQMMSGPDNVGSHLSAPKKNIQAVADLWVETMMNPAFRQSDYDNYKNNNKTAEGVFENNLTVMGIETLNAVRYPKDHPIRMERKPNWDTLTLEELSAYHKRWFRPDRATIFASGDMTLDELVAVLEKSLNKWKAPQAPAPTAIDINNLNVADTSTGPRFILVERKKAVQTAVIASVMLDSNYLSDEAPYVDAVSWAFGGGMSGRLSKNLRQDKGWSYGASAGASAPSNFLNREFSAHVSVQKDKTIETVQEMLGEFEAIAKDKPITSEELTSFVDMRTKSLTSSQETLSQTIFSMVENFETGRPMNWMEGEKTRLSKLTLSDVQAVAEKYLDTGRLTWVLVGEISEFEQKLRDLNLGTVEVWDPDGNRIR